MVRVNATKYTRRKRETSQNSLLTENVFLRLSASRLLSAQATRPRPARQRGGDPPACRPAGRVPGPAAAAQGSRSWDSAAARSRPHGRPAPSRRRRVAAGTRPSSPRVPANPVIPARAGSHLAAVAVAGRPGTPGTGAQLHVRGPAAAPRATAVGSISPTIVGSTAHALRENERLLSN